MAANHSAAEARTAQLLALFITEQVLKFGDFTLKSGRRSPYFFNLGAISTSAGLKKLAACYADQIITSQVRFDVLFGPAYKGIPLAVAVGLALEGHGHNPGIAFNRKERKDHGEGGQLVGAALEGRRVLLVDDVITAGTALGEAVDLVRGAGGIVAGVVIAMDRQERSGSQPDRTAVAALEQAHDLQVYSLIKLADLVGYLTSASGQALLAQGSDGTSSVGKADQDHGNLSARMVLYQSEYCIVSP